LAPASSPGTRPSQNPGKARTGAIAVRSRARSSTPTGRGSAVAAAGRTITSEVPCAAAPAVGQRQRIARNGTHRRKERIEFDAAFHPGLVQGLCSVGMVEDGIGIIGREPAGAEEHRARLGRTGKAQELPASGGAAIGEARPGRGGSDRVQVGREQGDVCSPRTRRQQLGVVPGVGITRRTGHAHQLDLGAVAKLDMQVEQVVLVEASGLEPESERGKAGTR